MFLDILKTSLFISAPVGALLLITPHLKARYSAKWCYVVWLVVAVRLLIPADISLPLAPIKVELPKPIIEAAQVNVGGTAERMNPLSEDVPENPNEALPVSKREAVTALNLIEIASLLWLAGMAVFLFVQVCAYQAFLRKLRAAQKLPVPDFILELLRQTGAGLNISTAHIIKLPEAVITDAVNAPVLVGIIRPRILLPFVMYKPEKLSLIMRHELIHYKRKDILYKLVLIAANAVHWFNPLVWLMSAQASKDIELACDDEVIRGLDKEKLGEYGDTIISIMPKKRRLSPMLSTHFGSGKKNMKERLKNLFDTTVKRRGVAALGAVIVCMVVATSFATFGYAADSKMAAGHWTSPITIHDSGIAFDEFNEGQPLNEIWVSNTSPYPITRYEITCLAYDKNRNPVALNWGEGEATYNKVIVPPAPVVEANNQPIAYSNR